MGHLNDAVKHLKFARNDTPPTDRQYLLQILPARMKEHELKCRLPILHLHPRWPSPCPRRMMLYHLDLNSRHRWKIKPQNTGPHRAINATVRQRKNQIARL